MSYLLDYSNWGRLHESATPAQIADQLERATNGLGTDEAAIESTLLSIDSMETLSQVNSILASNPKYGYKSLGELVSGELGTFDQSLVTKLKAHFSSLAKASPKVADFGKKINAERSIAQGKIIDNEYAVLPCKGMSKEVHVLFGGSHTSGYSAGSARPQNILKYASMLEPYSDKATIIITHHMNSLDKVRSWVSSNLDNLRVTSIAGFSQGGKETWKHAGDSSLKLVGLIDPSTYSVGVEFGSNTYLVCNPDNWGTTGFYGETRKKLEWYCAHAGDPQYKGRVECIKGVRHMDFGILKYFYQNYSGRL